MRVTAMPAASAQPSFYAKSANKPPGKPRNCDRRSREYLTPQEVDRLIAAAKKQGRYPHRDATMILIAYRHGLRVSELLALRWEQVDFAQGTLHVNRLKHGIASTHPLRGPEIRALRQLQREYPDSPYLFVSERKGPLLPNTFRAILNRAGAIAGIPFSIHPHMMRHSTGFYLASKGHDTRAIQGYLGHKCIQHTVSYTELAPDRFKDFWVD